MAWTLPKHSLITSRRRRRPRQKTLAKRLALDNADATGYSPSKAAWLDARAPLGAAIPHIHAIGPSVPLPHAQVWEGSVTPPHPVPVSAGVVSAPPPGRTEPLGWPARSWPHSQLNQTQLAFDGRALKISDPPAIPRSPCCHAHLRHVKHNQTTVSSFGVLLPRRGATVHSCEV